MADEKTIIDIEFRANPEQAVKAVKTIRDAVSSVSKQQTTGEKQSTAAQKQAARIASKARIDSAKDRKVEVAQQKWWQFKKPKLMQQELKTQQQITKLHKDQVRIVQQQTNALRGRPQYYRTPGARGWQNGPNGSGIPPGGGGNSGGSGPGWRDRMQGWGKRAAVGAGFAGQSQATQERQQKQVDVLSNAVPSMLLNAAMAVAGGTVSAIKTQLTEAISAYEQQALASAKLEGMGNLSSVTSASSVNRAGRMGYSLTDTLRHAAIVGRQTGQVGATNTAQEFSRIYGGSVEEVGGVMGGLTRGGQKFDSTGGGAGRRQMAHMFRDAVSSGLDRSRTGEHLEAVSAIAEGVGGRTSRDVNFASVSGMLGLLGSSGRSGHQGARGANVLSNVDEGIRSGGADDSAHALALAAAGYGYGGSNDVDLNEAESRLERGIFGEGGDKLLDSILTLFRAQTGGGSAMNEEMRRSGLFGSLTRDQIRDLVADVGANGGNTAAAISQFQARGPSIDSRIAEAGESTNLRVNRHQAQLENRSAGQGAQLYDSVMEMQNLVNSFIDRVMPAVITGLNGLADTLSRVATNMGIYTPQQRSARQAEYLALEQESVDSLVVANYVKAGEAATTPEEQVFNFTRAVRDATEELDQAKNSPLALTTDEHRRQYEVMQNANRGNLSYARARLDQIDPDGVLRAQMQASGQIPAPPPAVTAPPQTAGGTTVSNVIVLPDIEIQSEPSSRRRRIRRPNQTSSSTAPAYHGTLPYQG